MDVRIVVAASENNVIGIDNDLPWRLPDDLRFFKKMTMGLPVIMGRHTWESLGRALPGRLNVVISSKLQQAPEGVRVTGDLEDAFARLREEGHEEVAVIGGGKLYHAALPFTHTVYLTRVHAAISGGTAFFPVLPPDEWTLAWEERHEADEKHAFAFTFQKWVRK